MTLTLSIVTVVKDDLMGLVRTRASLDTAEIPECRWIVVDGSNDPNVQLAAVDSPHQVTYVGGQDSGIFDAMNIGLRHVDSDYVLFLNAGDELHAGFSWGHITRLSLNNRVVLGLSIERFDADRYVRPARRKAALALDAPAHQATIFPRSVAQRISFDPRLQVKADGRYSAEVIARAGAIVVDMPICVFALGGTSSDYSSPSRLRRRLAESASVGESLRLIAKFALWRIVGQRAFYRILAFRKYERVKGTLLYSGEVLAERGLAS